MTTASPPTAPPVKFTDGGYVLWHRPNRKAPWAIVAIAPTEAELTDAMDSSGLHHGQWLTRRADGRDPNTDPRPR